MKLGLLMDTPTLALLSETTGIQNEQIGKLRRACRDALGALWELHNWSSREAYDRDPTVMALREALK